MLSSGVNPLSAGNSTMPGDYGSFPALRNYPAGGPRPPLQPMMPTSRTPFPQISSGPQIGGPLGRTPFPQIPGATGLPGRTPFPQIPGATGLPGRTPFPQIPPGFPPDIGRRRRAIRPVRSHRHRRRPLTPDIVIDRLSRGRSSWGGRRVITIPLDNRPTLGLRGPPRRVIEIERIPCRRRRRCRSVCYEYDDDSPPMAQPTTLMANPLSDPYLSQVQPAMLPNLTPEMIENLPKQIVHLPPIHLPGSQANAETELNTVIFPAEIINPVDGTLSVIHAADPGAIGGGTPNIQANFAAPVQPQLINIPTTFGAPGGLAVSPAIRPTAAGLPIAPGGLQASPRMASDPLMQRFQEIFQRLRFPQTGPTSSPVNPPIIRPTIPTMTEFNPINNVMNNQPTISPINPANVGLYPSSNIRPSNTLNVGTYRPANITPSSPGNIAAYRPANITSYRPANTTTYRPANITPYSSANTTPYSPANITPYSPANTTTYRPANITPYSSANTTPYSPANTTAYRPSAFTPSPLASNTMYRPANNAPSNSSDINPYRPANITPYTNLGNRPIGNPSSQPSFSSAPTPYASTPSIASSGSFTTFSHLPSPPSGINNNIMNSSAPSFPQSTNSTPKSILRNGTSIGPSTTSYTNFNPSNISSSDDTNRKTIRFT